MVIQDQKGREYFYAEACFPLFTPCGTAGGLLGYHSLIAALARDAEWLRKWLSITQNTISRVQGWGANGCFHREGNLVNGESGWVHHERWDYVRLLSFTSVIWRSKGVMYLDRRDIKYWSLYSPLTVNQPALVSQFLFLTEQTFWVALKQKGCC